MGDVSRDLWGTYAGNGVRADVRNTHLLVRVGSWHGPQIQKLLAERRGKIETRLKILRVAFVLMQKQLGDGGRSWNIRTNTSKLPALRTKVL